MYAIFNSISFFKNLLCSNNLCTYIVQLSVVHLHFSTKHVYSLSWLAGTHKVSPVKRVVPVLPNWPLHKMQSNVWANVEHQRWSSAQSSLTSRKLDDTNPSYTLMKDDSVWNSGQSSLLTVSTKDLTKKRAPRSLTILRQPLTDCGSCGHSSLESQEKVQ